MIQFRQHFYNFLSFIDSFRSYCLKGLLVINLLVLQSTSLHSIPVAGNIFDQNSATLDLFHFISPFQVEGCIAGAGLKPDQP
jgi:hypothetical protein